MVIGQITRPVVENRYTTTWDGRPKLAMGRVGIIYNVKIGDPCFSWAGGEKVEPGVTVDGFRSEREKMAFRNFSCIGNKVKAIEGIGKEAIGTVVGKMGYLPEQGHHVLIHFEEDDLMKLSIGEKIQVKAWGVRL